MTTTLFWNLNKNENLAKDIAFLVREQEVDILVLAECKIPVVTLLEALNEQKADYFYAPGRIPGRIEMYTRFNTQFISTLAESNHYTIRRVQFPAEQDFILGAVHFSSKLHAEELDQLVEAQGFAQEIIRRENDMGHRRTILVGDFNMNPFDKGMAMASGIHGVMAQTIVNREARTSQQQSFSYFYNPMWSVMGDKGGRVPGTYYYAQSNQLCYYWNTYDQVLLRNDLLPFWQEESLQIITGLNNKSLLVGRYAMPDKVSFSDHLPIVFKLKPLFGADPS